MAVKQLMLRMKLKQKNKELEELRAKDAEFLSRKAALETRTAELEKSIDEANTDEERAAVEAEGTAIQEEESSLSADEKTQQESVKRLSDEIAELEEEIKKENEAAPAADAPPAPVVDERKVDNHMETRKKFFGMNHEERSKFFARSDVKAFIDEVRAIKTRGVTNGSLTIPDVMLDILRDNSQQYSKLEQYVTVKRVGGTSRQNIMGTAPEGVWMETDGALNELDMSLNQIEADGYMVGGILYISNALIEDSDIVLGSEIMTQLGQAIGKAKDRGILYGTGVKMPVGIATRLAQTSKPSTWGAHAPTWTDLHSTNILTLNLASTTGAAFFAALVAALGVAKPNYSDGRCFWAMNRKTHIDILCKALAFDAAAALVAGINNTMPIIGGDIVELEMPGDYEIIGGFGSVYNLIERAGARLESSEHVKFKENMTAFKGYARYDGMPVFGEAFVMVSYDNSAAATTSTFQTDYANTDLGVLGVVAAAGTASGDTVLTVTGAESSGTTLKYKIGDLEVQCGQAVTGYTALISGTTQITAAAGKMITVVELDGNSKVIKSGKVVSVPKT